MDKIDTKDKGDIGLAKIISDLTEHNIKVALPISEHLPFDLIAINQNCFLSKISVKYRTVSKRGLIEIPLRTISSNSRGYKVKICDLKEINAFAIYCPDNKQCYYINSKTLLKYKNSMSLRINPVKDQRLKDQINWGKDFQDISNIW